MIIRMSQKTLAGNDLQALQKERQRVMVPPKHNTKNIMAYRYFQVWVQDRN